MSTEPYRTPGDEPDTPRQDHPTVEIPQDTAATAADGPPHAGSPATADPAPSAAGTSTGTAPVPGAPPVRTGPRGSTVVWGVVVIAVAVGLLARTAGASVDAQLAAILLLGAAGLVLVVGSVVGAARRRRRTPS
ncbi:hypothetical protein [Isoptericola haloaureus]|uniref:LPXTG-motif cell wall-anchored protein n=1 Tax=Isoptericola haloaureus TaxID=1542902 RepID=A0ABU7Z8V1_9MICO